MPKFSPNITHVCLSGTHFTHAGKLMKDGQRTYMDKGRIKLGWHTEEAHLIFDHGIMAVEYSSAIFKDSAALNHFMAEDNLNVQIQMRQ